jgi:hypothetical protein
MRVTVAINLSNIIKSVFNVEVDPFSKCIAILRIVVTVYLLVFNYSDLLDAYNVYE